MKVGLLGFGVVGRGFYDITATREDINVAKVVCLEDVFLPDAEVTRDFKKVLEDDSIDTIVEAMGGLHPAYEFVRAAIEAGKNVVTSNKALVNGFYDELIPLAQEKGIPIQESVRKGGGNNAAAFQTEGRGCPAVVAGVPVRYVHAPNSMSAGCDMENTVKILMEILTNITPETIAGF